MASQNSDTDISISKKICYNTVKISPADKGLV